MLQDYFLLEITDAGLIKSLPLLLKGYVPNLDKLPLFLMRLGPQVRYIQLGRAPFVMAKSEVAFVLVGELALRNRVL